MNVKLRWVFVVRPRRSKLVVEVIVSNIVKVVMIPKTKKPK